ncbi:MULTISPECIES: cupin domain-containing protein [unclassified Streptomyces]|uniref:cupin domain-containing protein n=1 Tax=unclassified Streptomyces TaxID=2593676 RepID=UPI000DC7687A|nr:MULTISPECIES: cupin domain-containing protein [unclassified Streptomyces]AWZ03617.1 cupin [Streptomyces sp. ICC4]AWZ11014.1 cupin [Streptomyces sp. ICC1]
MIDSASWAQRLGGDTFLAQTCFRAHAVIRSAGAAVPTLLTWDDINEIVAAHRLEPPRMRLSRAGEAVPATAYSVLRTNRRGVSWYQPQPTEFHARLAEGASLVIDAIDQIHPPVRAAAAGLERFFRTPVQANAYASWTSEEGFGTHWDDHDVVVLQLEGSKRWKIYGPTRQAPAWRDVEAPEAPTGEPIADIVLTPGDLLYLPRGWWHAVSADQGTASLHLTFGLATQTGAEFLGWLCDDLRTSATVRSDVPRFGTPEKRADYLGAVRKEVLSALEDPAVLDRWERSLDTTHPGHPRLSLPHLATVPPEPGITVQVTVPRARVDQDAEAVTFSGAGREWTFALRAAPLLHRLAGGPPVTLGDLAAASGLTVAQSAEIVSALVGGQAAAVIGAPR